MGVIRDEAALRSVLFAVRAADAGGATPVGMARRQGLLDHEPHAKAYDCAHFQPEGQ